MRVLLLSYLCLAGCSRPKGHNPNTSEGNQTPNGGTLPGGTTSACPGWNPVIAFDGISTPAGDGLAGDISQLDGYAIMPPPIGDCYADCTAVYLDPYGDFTSITYTWDGAGHMVEASVADATYNEGMMLSYNDNEQIASLGYFEVVDGVRTEDEEYFSTYTYDDQQELLGTSAPIFTNMYDNTYADGHLVVVGYTNTYIPDDRVITSSYKYAWDGNNLVDVQLTFQDTTSDCAPDYTWEVGYDSDGRRVRETQTYMSCLDIVSVTTMEYSYDPAGRLVKVVETSGPADDPTVQTWDLEYDAAGRGVMVKDTDSDTGTRETGTGSGYTTTTITNTYVREYVYTCP